MTDARRRLPAVHTLLADAEGAGLLAAAPRALVTDAVRDTIETARREGGTEPAGGWLAAVRREIAARTGRSVIPVINATGVVLHTNLGRAPLAPAARDAMHEAAGYAAVEYDLGAGRRGTRDRHIQRLVAELTGADDAMVVNNAAAALVLTLCALASGGETIVSRGELVEIGGGFRIPEILATSGTVLVEVGTTNRTRIRDYETALSARTRCLLKVHRSNFHLAGFVQDAALPDLSALARPRALPVVHDAGSGLLLDLAPWGLAGEPLLADSVCTGALVVCSGDKLLGGPQAGLIAGPADAVAALRRHPLARALRPDKLTLAALEATLLLYRDPETARREIPTLQMLTADPDDLARRAARLHALLPGSMLTPGRSVVGGGAFPEAELRTTLVAIPSTAPDDLLAALRRHDPPVIARAADAQVLFDVRTLADDDLPQVAAAVAAGPG